MSLESAIELHAKALSELAAAILLAGSHAKTPKAEAKAAAPAEVKPSTAAPAALTYYGIKLPFLELVKTKGRDVALAAIAPLKTLKEVETQPEKFPALLAAIQKAQAEPAAIV